MVTVRSGPTWPLGFTDRGKHLYLTLVPRCTGALHRSSLQMKLTGYVIALGEPLSGLGVGHE